ncbi:Na+/H+ antiporter subunit G [Tropicimonas sp. IMCC34011]|uniref:Na+/H+ antiporter subunit G n=1 Tax=Tropicimonas sp. IMCC34011 TaxID=2248759 RepID=UPI000E259E24|nr:Na+/H+ antiporter subunit G [Tropicimonas sp. IMCC34011]
MSEELIFEIAVSFFLVAAGVFGLVGSFGLVKLPDLMRRLHGPTKSTTLGVGSVLIAAMIYSYGWNGEIVAHQLLITVFLLLTAPITANFLAKVYMHRHVAKEDLPDASGDHGWSGYDTVPEEMKKIDTK